MILNKSRCKHCRNILGATSSHEHCYQCASTCTTCNKSICVKYDVLNVTCEMGHIFGLCIKCASCEKYSCRDHYFQCTYCRSLICNKCKEFHVKECEKCGCSTCVDNGKVCKSCKKFLCYDGGCILECSCKTKK